MSAPARTERAGTPAIEVAGLVKRYGAIEAVRGISFEVRAGSTTALLGGNGAGKTTTLSMLLGVLEPTAGDVRVLGIDMRRDRLAALPRMNFTSPYVDLPKRLKVRENLRVFADLYGVADPASRIAALAEEFDLGALLARPYGDLSAGQRTRVSLAKALLNGPEVLLLDEPTASLDPDIGDRVRTGLERYRTATGCTMLIASHNMGEVERLCDDVIMLRAGRVVDRGSPAELVARYGRDTMEEVFLDVARAGDVPPERVPLASPQGAATASGRPAGRPDDIPPERAPLASPQGEAMTSGRPVGRPESP